MVIRGHEVKSVELRFFYLDSAIHVFRSVFFRKERKLNDRTRVKLKIKDVPKSPGIVQTVVLLTLKIAKFANFSRHRFEILYMHWMIVILSHTLQFSLLTFPGQIYSYFPSPPPQKKSELAV